MSISVVLIDNHKDYTWILGNRLIDANILHLGRYAYYEFIHNSLVVMPDIAIIALNKSLIETLKVISFIKEHYPSVRIIVNTNLNDKEITDKIIKT